MYSAAGVVSLSLPHSYNMAAALWTLCGTKRQQIDVSSNLVAAVTFRFLFNYMKHSAGLMIYLCYACFSINSSGYNKRPNTVCAFTDRTST